MVGLVGMSGLDGTHGAAAGKLTFIHLNALPLEERLDLRVVALHDGGHLACVAELTIIANCCFHVGGIYKEVRDLVPLTSESLYIIAVRKFS